MTSTNIRFLKVFIVIEVAILVIAGFFGGKVWILNTQIGFITSSLVMVASIISYKRMVNTRVEHGIITYDDSKDTIDILEDPYDLYSEEVVESEEGDNLTKAVKDEKDTLKDNGRTLAQTLKDTKAALSTYRLFAYAMLILGFMYLNRQELLHIPSYMIALGLPPIVIVTLLLQTKEETDE